MTASTATRNLIFIPANDADGLNAVIHELALTDTPALIEFLRCHAPEWRERRAVVYAAWLRETCGLDRSPAFIARNWARLAEYMPWEARPTLAPENPPEIGPPDSPDPGPPDDL